MKQERYRFSYTRNTAEEKLQLYKNPTNTKYFIYIRITKPPKNSMYR